MAPEPIRTLKRKSPQGADFVPLAPKPKYVQIDLPVPEQPKPKPEPKKVWANSPKEHATVVVAPGAGRQIVQTREGWLLAAVEKLEPLFVEAGAVVPTVRVSIGWPGGRGKKTGVIGQCWMPATVADGTPALFISPALQEPGHILETLVHELVHAAVNVTGHRAPFARLAGKVGLVAPWPATIASRPFEIVLKGIADDLGPFPHSKVSSLAGLMGYRPRVQTTRMLKLSCPVDGYVVRTTQKWINVGLPACPCGEEMVPA